MNFDLFDGEHRLIRNPEAAERLVGTRILRAKGEGEGQEQLRRIQGRQQQPTLPSVPLCRLCRLRRHSTDRCRRGLGRGEGQVQRTRQGRGAGAARLGQVSGRPAPLQPEAPVPE